MQQVILDRDDLRGSIHTGMFEYICEQFDINPEGVDSLTLVVANAHITDQLEDIKPVKIKLTGGIRWQDK